MRKYPGYTAAAVLFVIFQISSLILRFGPYKTLWAALWMILIMLAVFIQARHDLKAHEEKRGRDITVIAVIVLMTAGLTAVMIGSAVKLPGCELPLY